MILTDKQRDDLAREITAAIMDNDRTAPFTPGELERRRTELFTMCADDFQTQRDALEWRRPFYIPDDRGTFGFMRLRDANGRVLGYATGDALDDPDDGRYNPTAEDKRVITDMIRHGARLYYYIGDELATMAGATLKEYTRTAVREYERKRHRLFDLLDTSANNSAVYIAIHESYYSQYNAAYDFPTLPAGTNTRKAYYAHLVNRALRGELTYKHVVAFPRGKGSRPSNWDVRRGVSLQIRYAVGYNNFVGLNGRDAIADDENDVNTERYDATLFNNAVR